MNVSKSQIRAAQLLNIPCDPVNDEYTDLAQRLDALNVPADGIPTGHTWRTAAKLSDAEFVNQLRASFAGREVESLRSAYGE